VAARFEPVEEFRFFVVERAEPGGARLWLRRGCEPIDCCFATSVGGAKSVCIGALGAEPVGVRNGKPIGVCNSKPVWVHNTALVGRIGPESDRPVGQPADSECEHTAIKSKCQRQPTVVITERQPAEFIRIIRRKRVQRRKRRQGVNASGELSRIRESRRRGWQRWWWWASLSYAK
jgi:hypothetical protein